MNKMALTRRRILALLGVPAAVLLLLACSSKPTTIRMERAELQERFERKFPLETTKFLTKVTLTDPKVILRPGKDKLGASVAINVRPPLLGREFTGHGVASGTLYYVKEKKAFYLRDAELEELRIDGIPQSDLEKIKGIVESVAQSVLSDFPVYEFKDRDPKEAAASLVLQKVYVKDGALFAELGSPLAD